MTKLVDVDDGVLGRILDDTYEIWNDGLTRHAYGQLYGAQRATPFGRAHLGRLALVDGDEVLASAKVYRFDAVLDRQPLQIAGLGAVFTAPASRRRGAARELIERVLEREAAGGADAALLFSEIGPDYYARLGFTVVETATRELRVSESLRYGAPMTMVRGGDDRDLKDIVSLSAARAEPYRFHLVRDRDVVHFAIARKRLLAGLGPTGARTVQFFIAEEGASAVAYVVISVKGNAWSIEEMGDRDPSGARAGAILQALIAREPAERRPSIAALLPDDFLPPQVTVIAAAPAKDVMMIRPLTDRIRLATPLASSDVCYWHGDLF
jgi:predicted N-acetyltransferase YhbS